MFAGAKLGILLVIAYVILIPVLLVAFGVGCWLTLVASRALYTILGGA